VTRDYLLDLDIAQAPLLTVWGGKITTFRKLAEEAADLLAAPLHITKGAWTHGASLPGGDLRAWIGAPRKPDADFARFVQALAAKHPKLSAALRLRLAHAYGARVEFVLKSGELGAEVAPDLFEAELNYLHDHEWARSADDVLWRRSKLGLHLTPEQRNAVADWCRAHWADAAGVPSMASEAAWN
jgi:glycerol-3-phosphate dehydrogenase